MNNDVKKPNKVIESSKRNSMGIGASVATVLTWVTTSVFGVILPPEVAVGIASIVMMVISEIRGDD